MVSIIPKGRGKHRDDEEGLGAGPPPPRSVQIVATIALVLIGGFAAFSIAYASIVQGDQSATAILGSLATAALAALVVLSSGRHSD